MRKRFIIAVDATTPDAEKELTKLLDTRATRWWHWLNNLWLVSDPDGDLTASEVRDMVTSVLPEVYSLVIELRSDETDTWSGFGPKQDGKNMFTWLRANWNL